MKSRNTSLVLCILLLVSGSLLAQTPNPIAEVPARDLYVYTSSLFTDPKLASRAKAFYEALLKGHRKVYEPIIHSLHNASPVNPMWMKDAESSSTTSAIIQLVTPITFKKEPAYLVVLGLRHDTTSTTGQSTLMNVWQKENGEWKAIFLNDIGIDVEQRP